MELPPVCSQIQLQREAQLSALIPPKGGMVVEPVIVDIIDEARIERYLFRRPYVVKMRGVFKTPQIVLVLRSRHRRERLIDGTVFGEKCGGAGGHEC